MDIDELRSAEAPLVALMQHQPLTVTVKQVPQPSTECLGAGGGSQVLNAWGLECIIDHCCRRREGRMHVQTCMYYTR